MSETTASSTENCPSAEDRPDGRLHADWDSYLAGFASNPLIDRVRFRLVRGAYDRLLRGASFGDRPSFCELGSGTAVISRYLGDRYGADITAVDSNDTAMSMGSEAFLGYPNGFTSMMSDVFDLAPLAGSFDLVHSGGLIEHFVGDLREAVVKAHCDLAAEDGRVLMLVPTRNAWYRVLNEGVFAALHLLDDVDEIPWSLGEVEAALARCGFRVIVRTSVISELGVLAARG